jgi:deoxyribonuclease V
MRMMAAGLHPWAVSIQEAFRIQDDLKSKLRLEDDSGEPETIAGIDVAFSIEEQLLYAAVVVVDARSLQPVEAVYAVQQPTFPYIPGLLTFREGPVVLEAYERLSGEPDLLMFDGQGIAHPRGLGLASHLGVLLDKASIGCAKSRLVGDFKEPKQKRGSMRTLSFERRKVGVVLRTRDNTRPVFVSPGHRITVETAAARVLGATKGLRIPEPTRLADVEAERAKREHRR